MKIYIKNLHFTYNVAKKTKINIQLEITVKRLKRDVFNKVWGKRMYFFFKLKRNGHFIYIVRPKDPKNSVIILTIHRFFPLPIISLSPII